MGVEDIRGRVVEDVSPRKVGTVEKPDVLKVTLLPGVTVFEGFNGDSGTGHVKVPVEAGIEDKILHIQGFGYVQKVEIPEKNKPSLVGYILIKQEDVVM